MLSSDLKYISTISTSLRNFKKKNTSLWNFSCPICGDSKKDKTKARGYLMEYKNSLLYKCHNCGVSLSFKNFLKSVDMTIYSQYAMENHSTERVIHHEPETIIETKRLSIDLPELSELDSDHPAVVYAKSRKFTLKHMQRLYYVEDTRAWFSENLDQKYVTIKPDSRILIPFINEHGAIIGAQARSLNPNEKIRYVTGKKSNVPSPIFGLNHWNKNQDTYIVEGALDSLFLPNALAVNNASLSSITSQYEPTNFVFVFDNEPRNKEVCHCISRAVNKNLRVVVWPETITQKDINDMILSGIDVLTIIKENVYTGLPAKIKFDSWRKC